MTTPFVRIEAPISPMQGWDLQRIWYGFDTELKQS
jgi:hypothetical protein